MRILSVNNFLLLFILAEGDALQHTHRLREILTDTENPDLKDMKLTVALYTKQVYRVISAVGHNQVDKDQTLQHIDTLFKCIQSENLELKAKSSITAAYEQMLVLYRYQENDAESLTATILKILEGVSQQIASSS